MSLIAHAKRIAAQRAVDDLDDIHDPAADAGTTYVDACLSGCRDARDVLPVAALLHALGTAGLRRLQDKPGLAIVVQTPGPEWITGIELALRGLTPIAKVYARSGTSRSDKPFDGNDNVALLLSQGAKVAGVTHAPERYLPSALIGAADLVVRIPQPSNRVIADVIKAVTGRRARRLPPNAAAGLSYDAITAAIRLGTTPRDCIARLQAASRSLAGGDALGADVPDLEDLHGYGDAMVFARNLVRDLDEWRAGRLEWESIQRTCCLHSEPGLGKSSLIRSIAKSARLPLVTATVSEFFSSSSGYLDGVLKALELKISQAAAQAPAILFLDEVDAIPNRATVSQRGKDFWLPIIVGMLSALDSTTSNATSRLIVIGATNHADALDEALIRPGRLHPVIRIARPDAAALAGILRQHLGVDLADADLSGAAQLAVGGSGADATAWVRGARAVARAEGRSMDLADLIQQIAPADTRTPAELRVTALHESAHAVLSHKLDVATLSSVSIAMGAASGGCARARLVPRAYLDRAQVERIAIVALAGRAMDALSGAPHTGAGGGSGSDLARATETVLALHGAYGLGTSLAYRGGPAECSDAMRYDGALRRAVEADLLRLHGEALELVRQNRATIELVADRLIEARVLTGEQVVAIIESSHQTARPGNSGAKTGGRHAR